MPRPRDRCHSWPGDGNPCGALLECVAQLIEMLLDFVCGGLQDTCHPRHDVVCGVNDDTKVLLDAPIVLLEPFENRLENTADTPVKAVEDAPVWLQRIAILAKELTVVLPRLRKLGDGLPRESRDLVLCPLAILDLAPDSS